MTKQWELITNDSYPHLAQVSIPGEHLSKLMNIDTAKLIVATPDLLDALIMALPYVESELNSGGYKLGNKALKQIRAAINKAEGK